MPQTDASSELNYLIIGHVTRDLAPDGPRMGGTAAYSGLTARAFGASTALVTSCPQNFNLDALEGIQIHKVLSGRETAFENRYSGNRREQFVLSVAEPLGPVHIPESWLAPSIVHLAPVVGEVKPALFDLFPRSLLCVTLQGWMRDWDSSGRVRYRVKPEAEAAARSAHAAVFSLDDVDGNEEEAVRLAGLCPVSAVTDGPQGCRVFWKGKMRAFRAPPVTAVDPTGAGDIFAAAFFLELGRTGDAWEAARLATELATRSVERTGLAGVPHREEVMEFQSAGDSS